MPGNNEAQKTVNDYDDGNAWGALYLEMNSKILVSDSYPNLGKVLNFSEPQFHI